MTKTKLAFLFLFLLAVAMPVEGLLGSGSADQEALATDQDDGLGSGLLTSPLIYIGLLLLALAFGWRKFGRN